MVKYYYFTNDMLPKKPRAGIDGETLWDVSCLPPPTLHDDHNHSVKSETIVVT